MKNDKILSFISIAMKAGKVASGEFCVDREVKSGHARLVIIAQDASEGTAKSVTDMCEFYHVPCEIYGTKDSLGQAIGKKYRSQLAITDDGFAGNIQKLIRISQEE